MHLLPLVVVIAMVPCTCGWGLGQSSVRHQPLQRRRAPRLPPLHTAKPDALTEDGDDAEAGHEAFDGKSCQAFKLEQLQGGEQARRIEAFLASSEAGTSANASSLDASAENSPAVDTIPTQQSCPDSGASVAAAVSFPSRYFHYMWRLWRPEGTLSRKVHATRLQRWLNQLEEVLDNGNGLRAKGSGEMAAGLQDLQAACSRLQIALRAEEGDRKARATQSGVKMKKKSGLAQRLITGWSLGAACSLWIFSGNVGHALGLLLLAVVAQLEYYRSVIATGVYPARRISVVATLMMYVCACKAPALHQLVLPLAATWVMVWFLIMRPKPGTISEVSSSFWGIFYVGFLPSFWVRLRTVSEGLPVATLQAPALLAQLGLPADIWTQGAVVKWWVCFTIVWTDVFAYFGGKKFGQRPLSRLGRGAAGEASPNKTCEGALSGIAASVVLSTLGAHLMQWPHKWLMGPLFGVSLGTIALVGDLTASMFKRDAGVKDYGDLLPGHGGVLDRFDSYIFTGPFVYFFFRFVLASCSPPGSFLGHY